MDWYSVLPHQGIKAEYNQFPIIEVSVSIDKASFPHLWINGTLGGITSKCGLNLYLVMTMKYLLYFEIKLGILIS